MLDNLRQYTKDFDFYNINELPLNRDCFLISEKDFGILEKQYLELIFKEITNFDWQHPNNFINFLNCYVDSYENDSANINFLHNIYTRFHPILTVLPIKYFKGAIKLFSYSEKTYIIVEDIWFEKIIKKLYSSFAMIDIIGVYKMILKEGEFSYDKMNKIKSIIDEFASENPNITFLTTSDNIILKMNWTVNQTFNYNPEKFIILVNNIMNRLKRDVGLISYSVLSQGENFIDETKINNLNNCSNHLSLSSLSTPFIELFEIDNDIRCKIKNNDIEKKSFYIQESFYLSTNRILSVDNDLSKPKRIMFQSSKLKREVYYHSFSFNELKDLVNL